MTFRKTAVALTLSALFIPVAFAEGGATWLDGEVGGYEFHVTENGKTRAEVKEELATSRSNPVTGDGWQYVGGEVGFAPDSALYDRIDAKWVRTDSIERDTPGPGLVISAEERRLQRQIYFGS